MNVYKNIEVQQRNLILILLQMGEVYVLDRIEEKGNNSINELLKIEFEELGLDIQTIESLYIKQIRTNGDTIIQGKNSVVINWAFDTPAVGGAKEIGYYYTIKFDTSNMIGNYIAYLAIYKYVFSSMFINNGWRIEGIHPIGESKNGDISNLRDVGLMFQIVRKLRDK